MTRQTRTLIILAVVGVGSVVVLGAMAQRYARLLERDAASPARSAPRLGDAQRQIEAFVRVRRSLRLAIDIEGARPTDTELLRVRDRALVVEGLEASTYERMLADYLDWKHARGAQGGLMRADLDRRRDQLAQLDLGPREKPDL
ncbi:MAG: hypothetical protein GY716_13810 [bacterium]|nr:hypothetical protein [bacterium]